MGINKSEFVPKNQFLFEFLILKKVTFTNFEDF